MKFSILDTELGTVVLFARVRYLSRLDLLPPSRGEVRESIGAEFPGAIESPGPFRAVTDLLGLYLKGDPVEFDVPVDLEGLTPFTALVLAQTRKISYGKVASYGNVASALGNGKAARAVGQALGRNPIPLVIPCHRVVKGDGTLGGFGLGADVKARLLAKEGVSVPVSRTSMMPS
jgi:methylated-DNA-[protein]-cysteine S-methyltransferase